MRTPNIAHPFAEDVHILIDGYAATDAPRLSRKHTRDAQRIATSQDIQPRLVHIHRQTHDMQLNVTALKAQAATLGLGSLADQLDTVLTTVHRLMGDVAEAAAATTSEP
ncbi:hypothetical protein [Streptomyces geysiriensis]|uniref:hypothetical protein n=1 Tax=Streptomyces geysiriensis TaxID=68207 RepID=UPI001C7D2C60|nr:hypothetical protein [Streptomyces geysiriensis]MBX4175582.1 hypothetical protein [Streptomyces geysiriensis]